MCMKATSVCPSYKLPNCLTTCEGQADAAFQMKTCGQELYDALRCISQLDDSDVMCSETGAVFNGCLSEQAAYAGC